MLTLAAAIGWNLFQDQLMRAAFVPGIAFESSPQAPAPDYASPAAWLSRPDLPDDPSHWTPPGFAMTKRPEVAVFYASPTTFLRRDRWNAPLDDRDTNDRLRLFAASQASAFNGMGAIWAPRYRQATAGAFLKDSQTAEKALDFAYRDIDRAFTAFIASIPRSRPILLAGHSQGSLHLLRLIRERIAGTPLQKRVVAAYLAGWPVSIEADIPALGLAACEAPGQTGCIIAWQSFAEPADPRLIRDYFDATTGLTGKPRKGTAMLCVNPLTGAPNTAALRTANLGALVPRIGSDTADIKTGLVPARCDSSGLLMIGQEPAGYGSYVLPGRNYHVFDYALFWANIRADADARARAFLGR